MLKEVESHSMDAAYDPLQLSHQLRAFEALARETASSLFTAGQLSLNKKNVDLCTALANGLLADCALWSWLSNRVSQHSSLQPHVPINVVKVQALTRCVEDYAKVVEAIDRLLQDPIWQSFFDAEPREPSETKLTQLVTDQQLASDRLDACVKGLLVSLAVARPETLGETEQPAENKHSQELRLNDAPGNSSASSPERLPFIVPPPSFKCLSSPNVRGILELQHPRGFRGRYGHPDFPLDEKTSSVQLEPADPRVKFDKSFEEAESERSRLRQVTPTPNTPLSLKVSSVEGRYPNVASFGCWPPSFIAPNTIREGQLRGMATNENAHLVPLPPSNVASPVSTPDSTRDNNVFQGSGGSQNQKTTTNPFQTSEGTTKPTFSSTPPHLEAYIIRTHTEDVHSAVEWTYKIEQLPLSEDALQVHVRKLGEDHSIIDDICELHPEQLRLIKLRAKHRKGTLVSAKMGKPVDMVTKMGTFQVKSVVFIVQTSEPVEEDDETKKYDVNGNKILPSLFGNQAPKLPVGGFGNSSRTAPGFGLFGTNPPTSSFGNFGVAPAPRATSLFATQTAPFSRDEAAARKYCKQLEENGEICTYVESGHQPGELNHYQTIVPTLGKDISFEELRQVDTAAGRHGPMKGNTVIYPWDLPRQTSATHHGGLFGGASKSGHSGGLFSGLGLKDGAQDQSSRPTQDPSVAVGSNPFDGAAKKDVAGGLGSTTQNNSVQGLFSKLNQKDDNATARKDSPKSSGKEGGKPTQTDGVQDSFAHSTQTPSLGGLFGSAQPSNNSSKQSTPPMSGGLSGSSPPSNNIPKQSTPPISGGLFGSSSSPNTIPKQSTPPTLSGLSGSTQPSNNSPKQSTAPILGGLFGSGQPSNNNPKQNTAPTFGRQTSGGGFRLGGAFGQSVSQNEQPTSSDSSGGLLSSTTARDKSPTTNTGGSFNFGSAFGQSVTRDEQAKSSDSKIPTVPSLAKSVKDTNSGFNAKHS